MRKYQFGLFVFIFFIFLSHPATRAFAACTSIPAVGSKSYTDATCTVNADTVSGIDLGTGTTNTAVLTLNTPNTQLTVNACATLLVGSISLGGTVEPRAYISVQNASVDTCLATGTRDSGKIKPNGPIYITDADGDTYPSNTTLYAETAADRRRLATQNANWQTTFDCNDGSATYLANLTCYPNADGDAAYSTTSHSVCAGATCASIGESATVGTDCNDGSNLVATTHAQCYADADGDTYTAGLAANTTCLNSASCATATQASASTHGATVTAYTAGRLLNAANGNDCKEAGTNPQLVWVSATCYLDSDNDNYGSTTNRTCMNNATCLSATAGSDGSGGVAATGTFSNVSTDCCDSNANAFPGQTAYFDTPMVNAADCAITTANDYNYDCVTPVVETLDATGFKASTYACTNPCSGCALNYSVASGWLTAPPAACGGTGTFYTMSGSYVSGTCYAVACASLASSASIKRGCH